MPKLKTNKAVRKRFRVTKNKKVLMHRTKRRHLLTDRPASKKRKFRRVCLVDPVDRSGVIKSLPYGSN